MKIKRKLMILTVLMATGSIHSLYGQSQTQPASSRDVNDLEKRISTVEARLGRNVTTPTATNNLERRIDDLEGRVKDLEDLTKALEKLERRVRDLERKK